MTRIAVLASGGGSNMQAVMDAIEAGTIAGRLVLVIADRPTAFALERARRAGVPAVVIEPGAFADREAYTQAITARLQEAQADLVLLAGFMRILTGTFNKAFSGRAMNIHPALIPSFCGKGYYGHHVHEAVLAYGAKVSGCTVHFVVEEVDAGPIIVQRTVPVQEHDTPDTLAARVLEQEHVAFPEAVRLFCADRLRIVGRRVQILPG